MINYFEVKTKIAVSNTLYYKLVDMSLHESNKKIMPPTDYFIKRTKKKKLHGQANLTTCFSRKILLLSENRRFLYICL